jgi:hypothetical protein
MGGVGELGGLVRVVTADASVVPEGYEIGKQERSYLHTAENCVGLGDGEEEGEEMEELSAGVEAHPCPQP